MQFLCCFCCCFGFSCQYFRMPFCRHAAIFIINTALNIYFTNLCNLSDVLYRYFRDYLDGGSLKRLLNFLFFR